LATKLYIPSPRPELVPRPRLIARLNEGLHRKLTLISAPAGFGKTTLVSDWLRQLDLPAAWLSLDADDNDPARFLTYFITALQRLEPELGQAVQDMVRSPHSPSVEALMITLINDMATLPDEFVFILDDYHVIDAQPIQQALTFLLEHIPPQMHLIIAGRADPTLPLSRLRGRDQVTELREADLRFTAEEAAAFLNEVMKLNLSAADVAALEDHTEGWITGLQLAGLSLREQMDVSGFIDRFRGSDRYIMDYLTDEVLSQQPAEIQTFLLQSSILSRLAGPLCDAVTQREDCQPLLERLEAANMFIIPLDNERCWYRYHPLFSELLQHRLQRSQPDLIPTLHRRAGDWYERNGWVNEAVNHMLWAADYHRAAGLIVQNARGLLKRGQAATLWGWLDRLPEEVIRVDPHLNVALVWTRLLLGPLTAFDPILQQAEQAIISVPVEAFAERRALLAEVQAMRVIAAVEQGDTSPAVIQLAQQSLDDLSGDSQYLSSALATSLALAYHVIGDTNAAIQSITTAKSIAEQSHNIFSILFTGYELAELHIEHGRLYEAELLHRQALDLVESRFGSAAPHIPLVGAAHIGLGKLFYEWNDLDKARQHLERGFELVNQPGGVGFPREASVAMAFLHQALGDEQAAISWMRRAEAMALTAPRPQIMAQVALSKVRLQLAQGQVTAAHRWAQASNLDIRQVPDFGAEPTYLTLVRIALAQKDRISLPAAVKAMRQLLNRAEAQQRWGRAIEILILQALAYQALDQAEQAFEALEKALIMAEPEGYVRRFVDEDQPMADLLARMKAEGRGMNHYLLKLRAAIKIEQSQSSSFRPQPVVEPLTERELEILNLIAAGLSNKAIAETLFVTVGTVKRHTMNIYGKLEVNSRTQATAKARALKLIE
jgi:LuxR family maltose regulon positive regulatory protein